MSKLMTASEVAQQLRITRVHVWRLVKSGRLPAPFYPVPKMARWHQHEITALIEGASNAR